MNTLMENCCAGTQAHVVRRVSHNAYTVSSALPRQTSDAQTLSKCCLHANMLLLPPQAHHYMMQMHDFRGGKLPELYHCEPSLESSIHS